MATVRENCPSCNGSGKRETSCPLCGGSRNYNGETCYKCTGWGRIEEYCGACSGRGYFERDVSDAGSGSSSYDGSSSSGYSSSSSSNSSSSSAEHKFMAEGGNYYNNEDYDNAIQSYTNAINCIGENTYRALSFRGTCYFRKGNYNQAIDDYNKIIRANIDDFSKGVAYFLRGDVYSEMKNYNQAITDYKKAVELGVDEAKQNLANLQSQQSGSSSSPQQQSSGSSIPVPTPPVSSTAAPVSQNRNSADEPNALENSNDPGVLCELAQKYFEGIGGFQKNEAKGLELYTKAAELGNRPAMYELGREYGVNKNYEKALYWYGKAAELGDLNAALRVGQYHMNGWGVNQDFVKAEEYFNKLISSGQSQYVTYGKNNLKELKKKQGGFLGGIFGKKK